MAVIGRDKNDPGLLVGHAQDEGFDFPVIHGKLEFDDKDSDFVPVLSFCPIIDANKDEESQRRIADKLKTLMIDSIKFPMRIRWDPNGELLGLVVKDNKKLLVPLIKKIELPKQ